PSGDWKYQPICAVLDAATGAPIDEHICLAGRLADEALYCFSESMQEIIAYDFKKRTWQTVAKGDFLSPVPREGGGKLMIRVARFQSCPERAVVSYREHYNGGGGVQSPGFLVFDRTRERVMMTIASGGERPDPGFCTFDDLLNFATQKVMTTASQGVRH